jgi:TatD DNase family protein
MNQYIDIGINLMHRSFIPDRENVIRSAAAVGVFPLIITGTSLRSSETAADYAARHKDIYSTAGVHPHDAKTCDGQTIENLRRLCKKPQVLAVGECGLDYDLDFSPRDVQRKWFDEQIQLAVEENMPLFLHERAAFVDFTKILAAHREVCGRAVVHCFTGTRDELRTYLDLGCYIGITGWICDQRRGMGLRDIVKFIPADKLMIETDGPFLLPHNLSEHPAENRNEPRFLPHIAPEIAACRGETVDGLAEATTANTKRFFGIE